MLCFQWELDDYLVLIDIVSESNVLAGWLREGENPR